MRHRLALVAVLGAATICGGGRAVAQLAVTDTAREATETSIKPFIIISTFRRRNTATVFGRTNGFFLDRFVVVASTNEPCS